MNFTKFLSTWQHNPNAFAFIPISFHIQNKQRVHSSSYVMCSVHVCKDILTWNRNQNSEYKSNSMKMKLKWVNINWFRYWTKPGRILISQPSTATYQPLSSTAPMRPKCMKSIHSIVNTSHYMYIRYPEIHTYVYVQNNNRTECNTLSMEWTVSRLSDVLCSRLWYIWEVYISFNFSLINHSNSFTIAFNHSFIQPFIHVDTNKIHWGWRSMGMGEGGWQ